jgi:hypothetical protein
VRAVALHVENCYLSSFVMPRKSVILSQEEKDKKIEEFREWIKNEPDLPQNIGRIKKVKF